MAYWIQYRLSTGMNSLSHKGGSELFFSHILSAKIHTLKWIIRETFFFVSLRNVREWIFYFDSFSFLLSGFTLNCEYQDAFWLYMITITFSTAIYIKLFVYGVKNSGLGWNNKAIFKVSFQKYLVNPCLNAPPIKLY